jgi:hypothetical protein
MVLCLLWIISLLVIRIALRRRAPEGADKPPYGRALRRFALAATVGFIGLAFLSLGSVLGPSLIIGSAWLVFVLVRVVKGVRKPRSEREPKALLILNRVFLVLALVAVPCAYVRAGSTRMTIWLMGYPTGDTDKILVPRLIARGEKAVGPLIEASKEELADGTPDASRMEKILYCLGRIGGPDARDHLREIVERHVDFASCIDLWWQTSACFTLADLAGEEAVPSLRSLRGRLEVPSLKGWHWVPVVAAATTGTRSGV